jgi:thiamine-phosphate pyrophosphorylase|tara:strand:+ start:4182 stop:4805 length:624 start_codon:yes stop_codon:yes gene_type:complete
MVAIFRNLKRLIYLISPNKIDPNFYDKLNKVLASKKVSFFQLRLKNRSSNEIIKVARKIRIITKKFKVKLIINDNSIIAKKVKADGCHLGQKDDSLKLARKNIKKKIIGITCHGSKKLARDAYKNKCDYIALGSFFKSKLKPKAKKADLKILLWAKKNIKKPIVVIGGITDKNYKKLINYGANYIALSTFIWNNPSLKPETAIKKFI